VSAVLVTGGTGAVGRVLVEELARQGHDVRVLARRDVPEGLFPSRVQSLRGDMEDHESLRRATEGVGVVYHLAARLHEFRAGPAELDVSSRVNLAGTRVLAQAARASGVSRFVFFSTISVYGPAGRGEVHDESSPLRPDSAYAETKAAAEEAVRSAGLPSVVLRLAAVYGPGMKGNYPRLVEALRRHLFVLVGDGRNRRTLVHVSDAVRAALLAAENPAAPGQTFNVTDGSVHTLRTIIDAICLALGRNPVRLRLPAGAALKAAQLIENLCSAVGCEAPVGSDAVRKILEDMAVRGDKARAHLGFRAEMDLISGWAQTVRGHR
jgi:UDP-glucose 4-epimerase